MATGQTGLKEADGHSSPKNARTALQWAWLAMDLALKSPAFGPSALALIGVASAIGCGGGGSKESEKKPDPKPQPTPQEREEAARLAELNRLDTEPKKDDKKIEVKTMDDFAKDSIWEYDGPNHTVRGYTFVVSSTVTDSALRAQLEDKAKEYNNYNLFLWAHEYKHAENAKFPWTIKEHKNAWKVRFLDEVSAFLAGTIIRNNLLNVVSDTASQLMFEHFNGFSDAFDNGYRSAINYMAFSNTNFISCSYDSDEWFQKALNALFTYEINGQQVNLFQLMKPADQEAFMARLDTKFREEYKRYFGYDYRAFNTASPFNKPNPQVTLLASVRAGKIRG
jgi:hypothetical protein